MAQDLTDAQWALIEPLLPQRPTRIDGRGRPWRDSRAVWNGLLWVLRTGVQWAEWPRRDPSYPTGHRRCQPWRRAGVMAPLLDARARDWEPRGQINRDACLVDGRFRPANKGATGSARPRAVRVARSWRWPPARVFLSPDAQPALGRMRHPSWAP